VLLASPFASSTIRSPNCTLRRAGWLRKLDRRGGDSGGHVLVSASPSCGTGAPLLYASSLPAGARHQTATRCATLLSYSDGDARRTERHDVSPSTPPSQGRSSTLRRRRSPPSRHTIGLTDPVTCRGRRAPGDRVENSGGVTARPGGFEPPTLVTSSGDRVENSGGVTARPGGFEPPTFGSVDRRSIQLSYGRPRASLSRCELCAMFLLRIFESWSAVRFGMRGSTSQ
jgi:hypothetical protein